MFQIKVQCGCGQRYAFEIEPVNGQVPAPVACPVCGADGTAAANAAIAQSLAAQPGAPPAQPAAPAARPGGLRIAAAPAAPARTAPRPAFTQLPGQIDRTQAEHEARAKMLWGDPAHEVTKFLMIHGFSYEEAAELVQEMYKERLATIRGRGIVKIVVGILLICVPIVAWIVFVSIGVIYVRIFVATIVAGLVGLGVLINGIWMLAAPKSEQGDAAGQ